jgi:hypothetical protein
MVTNFPNSITPHEGLRTSSAETQTVGFGGRAFDWLRQMLCGLFGHDTMMRFERQRLSLRCASCGHETSGWNLNEARPTATIRGDNRHHPIARPQLVGARRIA